MRTEPENIARLLLAALIVSLGTLTACAPDDERTIDSDPTVEPASPFPAVTGTLGCALEQLTDEPYDEFQFQGVSPDGAWLAYGWDAGEAAEATRREGTIFLDLITGDRHDAGPDVANVGSFSPDGELFAFAAGAGERTDLFELDLATDDVVPIVPHPAWDYLPSYSPDGRHILFHSSRSGNFDLFLYERSMGRLTQLTDYTGYDANGEFSPDGSRVVFNRMVSEREGGGYDFDLYAHDLATGEETRLTSAPTEESYPSWAPDGETLVLSSDAGQEPEKRNLYVRAPDGSLTRLTDGDWADAYSYWTRDGRWIYFHSNRNGNTDVFRLRMDGHDCARSTAGS